MRRTRTARFTIAGAALGLALSALPGAPASAATFTVSNTNDSGPGSLRQAVVDANTAPGADTVVIPAGLGAITLTSTIQLTDTSGTTIQGNGNTVSFPSSTAFNSNFGVPYTLDTLTIEADQAANTLDGDLTITNSILDVTNQGANTLNGTLTVANSTITSSDDGLNTLDGDIAVTGTAMAIGDGTGINSRDGAVTLTGSTIVSTVVDDGQAVNTSSGDITVTESEIAVGDRAVNSGSGAIIVLRSSVIGTGDQTGTGVNDGEGPISVVNSTVTGWLGDGVDANEVNLVYATVVDNGLDESANVSARQLNSFGSVLAGAADDCAVEVVDSAGYNFSDDDTCGWAATGDTENGGDPGLGALADNGGPARTFLPQSGSPLIDAIPTADCQDDGAAGITTDERGLPRPAQNGCDIGAVEVQPPPPPPTTASTTTTTQPSTTTTRPATAATATPRYTG
ncbi:MAG: hypothetical protein MUF83_09300 [Acidimicrobiales bacterium]|jgi:hypothetical protein|nr:hypothetical protein [Acidimicrobiales bacterium]